MNMTHASRYRSSSPGSRRLVDPLRASTGSVGGEIYASPTSYHGYLSPLDAERRGGFFGVDYADRLEAHPISTTTYKDANNSTKLKTSYAIRPRSHTTTDSSRRPLSLSIPSSTSSSRKGPIVTSGYGRSTSPLTPRASHLRDESEQYLSPATSGRSHKRIYSSDYTSDSGYGKPNDRHKHQEPRYRNYRPGGSSRHNGYGDPRHWDDSRYYDAYSYTNARETFEKESAARSSQRTHRRVGRPASMMVTDSALVRPLYEKDTRRPPPSTSHRAYDRHPDEDRLRITSGREHADSEARWDPHRHPTQQRLVLHQDREDGYQSFTDDYKHSSRHRHRSRPRETRKRAEDFLAPVLSGLATLGLASGYSDDGRDTDRSRRSNRYRSRDSEHDDNDRVYSRDREREKAVPDDERKRHHHRRHRDLSRRPGSSSDYSSSDEHSRRRRREKSTSRKQHDSEVPDGRRDRLNKEDPGTILSARKDDASSKMSVDRESMERPRKPVAVEPPTAKEPEVPPKGILKAPREKFPEDKNHIREGVAPLKDAQKNGIPPGARWTKIDRRLVNPAALEQFHERFEQRPEYVIVLRVLTKEEIQAFAVKTQEIRDANYKAAQEERRRVREERRRNGQPDSSSTDDEEDDEEETPLAIEPAPVKDEFPVPRGKDRVAGDVAEAMKSGRS